MVPLRQASKLADGQKRADLKHVMHPGTPSASQLELADRAEFPEENARFDDFEVPSGGEGGVQMQTGGPGLDRQGDDLRSADSINQGR